MNAVMLSVVVLLAGDVYLLPEAAGNDPMVLPELGDEAPLQINPLLNTADDLWLLPEKRPEPKVAPARVMRSVCRVLVVEEAELESFPHRWSRTQNDRAARVGSGVVYAETEDDYLVLTAAHLVGTARTVTLEFARPQQALHVLVRDDGPPPAMLAEVAWVPEDASQPENDVAILRLPKRRVRGLLEPVVAPLAPMNRQFDPDHVFLLVDASAGAKQVAWEGFWGQRDNHLVAFGGTFDETLDGAPILDRDGKEVLGLVVRQIRGELGVALTVQRLRELTSQYQPPAREGRRPRRLYAATR